MKSIKDFPAPIVELAHQNPVVATLVRQYLADESQTVEIALSRGVIILAAGLDELRQAVITRITESSRVLMLERKELNHERIEITAACP